MLAPKFLKPLKNPQLEEGIRKKKWLIDSEEQIWSEKCLVEVDTGIEEAGVLKGDIEVKE